MKEHLKKNKLIYVTIALLLLGIVIVRYFGTSILEMSVAFLTYIAVIYPLLKSIEKSNIDNKKRKFKFICGMDLNDLEKNINAELLNLNGSVVDITICNTNIENKVQAYILYY